MSGARALRLGLVLFGLGFGVAVEWAFYDASLGLASLSPTSSSAACCSSRNDRVGTAARAQVSGR